MKESRNDRAIGWMPFVAGALLGVSYFPYHLFPLHFVAFLPMLRWLDEHPRCSSWDRVRAGLAFGITEFLVMLHFMYAMLAWSWLAAVLYVALTLVLGARVALTWVVAGWLRRRTDLSWGLLLPIAWLPFEWLQSWTDLRMTADHLGHSMSQYPFLVQFADVVGPYGVGACLLSVSGLLYEVAFSERRLRSAVALAVIVLLVVGYDLRAWNRPLPDGPTIRVGLVQPNVPLAVKSSGETAAEQWRILVTLTRRAAEAGAELVVWPETARPLPLQHWLDRPETYAMYDVQHLAQELGVSILAGVEYYRVRSPEDYELYNAAIVVSEHGELLEPWGAKVYLVPFTEAVPFRSLLGPLVEGRGGEWRWLSGGFTPGPRNALVPVGDANVGVLVCYEQLFPDLARGLRRAGAQLQAVMTNDVWWQRSVFQPYLANALRLRAIENRSAFVRVANTGISGFVDPRGRYLVRTDLLEEAVEVAALPLTDERTVYDRTGDAVAWASIAALLGLTGLLLSSRHGHTSKL